MKKLYFTTILALLSAIINNVQADDGGFLSKKDRIAMKKSINQSERIFYPKEKKHSWKTVCAGYYSSDLDHCLQDETNRYIRMVEVGAEAND